MNLTPYLHLAWKEFRAMRAFWLSIVVLVALLQWTLSALYFTPTSVILLYTFGLAAPAFFAIGVTGAAFAMEREEGTFDFLRAAPISAQQIFVSKLGGAAVATAGMFVVLWLSTLLFTYPGSPAALDGMLGLWIMGAVEAIAWGTLCSLLTARPLVAICLALAAASTVTHLLAWSVTSSRLHEFEFAPYLTAVPWRALVAVIVLAGDVYLGLRWLDRGTRIRGKSISEIARRKIKERRKAEAVTVEEMLLKPDRGAMLGHLLWQHWRQSAWLMALMAGLALVTLFMMALFETIAGYEQRYALVPLAVYATLMGCCVFLPDQERQRFRYFVEHNIPPRWVWFTRQVSWIVTLVAATFILCLFLVPWQSIASLWQVVRAATEWQWYDWQSFGWRHEFIPFVELPPLALGLGFAVVSYAAGQWTSMMVRSGIMAGFFGLLLSGVLCGWVLLMDTMQVNYLWSVVPIPVVLLWATWLRAPDWATGNTRWVARWRAGAAVLAPALALVVTVPIYRVHQVPWCGPGFDLATYSAQITPESKATAALYRRANELYAGQYSIEVDEAAEFSGREPTLSELKWLAANAKPLALVLEASQRPTCNFGDPSTLTDRIWLRSEYGLISLILTSGRQLEAEGKLDEALDRYFAALRVASHWADYSLMDGGTGPARITERVFSEFAYWAAQKGQTPERVGAAIKRLQTIDASVLRLDEILKSDYIVARRAVLGDLRAWMALSGEMKMDRGATRQILWGKLMPWEKYRGLRMLDRVTDMAQFRLQAVRDELAEGDGLVALLAPSQRWNPAAEFDIFYFRSGMNPDARRSADWLATTYALEPGIGPLGTSLAAELAEFEAHRRAALLLLALEAYRLERGELPQSLDDLVGPYFDALPRDPYSGYAFSYFPAGLPAPATPLEAAQLEKGAWRSTSIVPGKPCIWCTGARLLVRDLNLGEPRNEPPEPAEKPKPVLYYTSREHGENWQPLLPYEAWTQGYWFPILNARR